MKKILFITYKNPERQDVGDHVYTWQILLALKHSGINVHVVTYRDNENDYEKNSQLAELVDKVTYVLHKQKNKIAIAFSSHPITIANRYQQVMIDTVNDVLQKDNFDAVVVNMFKMSWIVEHIFVNNIIFISHNNETLTAKTIYQGTNNLLLKFFYYIDYLKTKHDEKHYLNMMSTITTISDSDARSLGRVVYRKTIKVLPPMVNLINSSDIIENKIVNEKYAIICGSFTWIAKILNLKSVLEVPTLHKLNDNGIKLLVVGRASKELVDEVNAKYNCVEMTGGVDSVQPYYAKAQIAIVPEKIGGGFKLKIAEAVQNKIPIVAIRGAVTDNEMIAGVHFLEVDNFEDIPQVVVELMNNKELQLLLVNNCLRLFKRKYSLENMSYIINQIL